MAASHVLQDAEWRTAADGRNVFVTVSGWVMELFECIPKAGDFHTDEEFKLEIEVTEMSGKRIEQVRIRDLREPEEEEKE